MTRHIAIPPGTVPDGRGGWWAAGDLPDRAVLPPDSTDSGAIGNCGCRSPYAPTGVFCTRLHHDPTKPHIAGDGRHIVAVWWQPGHEPAAAVDPDVKEWIATFGSSHTHPLTGEPLRDCYLRIRTLSSDAAQQLMAISVFGLGWAFLYGFADDEDVPAGAQAQSAGVRRWGLREIEWIPPSPVAEALWAAWIEPDSVAGNIAASRWIRDVIQPAETAHQRETRRLMTDLSGGVL